MSNHDHLSNIGLHPAYDPDPEVHIPVRVDALRRRISAAEDAIVALVGEAPIPVGSTVSLTIGRNVGLEPLSDEKWARFQTCARNLMTTMLRPAHLFEYAGTGQWDDIVEDSMILVACQTSTGFPSAVRDIVSDLAVLFGQDAIALTIGTTDLVGPVR